MYIMNKYGAFSLVEMDARFVIYMMSMPHKTDVFLTTFSIITKTINKHYWYKVTCNKPLMNWYLQTHSCIYCIHLLILKLQNSKTACMYRSLINTSTGIWVKKLYTSHPKYDKNTVQNNALTLLRYLIS